MYWLYIPEMILTYISFLATFYFNVKNGNFLPACNWRQECEVLTEARLVGHGNVSLPSKPNYTYADILQEAKKSLALPNFHYFDNIFGHSSSNYTNNTNDWWRDSQGGLDCIPNCLPANWRSQVTQHILTDHNKRHATNNHDYHSMSLQVVPTWWQFVDRGRVNGLIKAKDCTHKSLSSIMNMNNQLVRQMIHYQSIQYQKKKPDNNKSGKRQQQQQQQQQHRVALALSTLWRWCSSITVQPSQLVLLLAPFLICFSWLSGPWLFRGNEKRMGSTRALRARTLVAERASRS
jgi:hypothetical protein